MGSDVGPWKITRVLDAHLEAATVLKAVRRGGDALQERAVMLFPKPPPESNAHAAARKLSTKERRALERMTMLGAVSAPSLPAVESDYGMTSDEQLGWVFMEYLGNDSISMSASGLPPDEGADDAAKSRCTRAVKYGLRLLAALRPLHAAGLVHGALAPKHIMHVPLIKGGNKDGATGELKLVGLENLHLVAEPSHTHTSPGVREYASPEVGSVATPSTPAPTYARWA